MNEQDNKSPRPKEKIIPIRGTIEFMCPHCRHTSKMEVKAGDIISIPPECAECRKESMWILYPRI